MIFKARPHFEDRQMVQYIGQSIRLSGSTLYNSTGVVTVEPTILDFTGSTSGQTTVTINGLTGYLNNGNRLSGFVFNPAKLITSGTTPHTTTDVTGYVLTAINSGGTVNWLPITVPFTGNTSANCINDLYVENLYSCTNLNINPNDEGNVYFGSTSGFTVDLLNGGSIYVKGDHIVNSDNISNISDLPSSLENEVKGGYTEFNWSGLTANILNNTNTSGYTSFLLGDLSLYPTTNSYGFLSYYGSGYLRNGSPTTGNDFYQNKMILKTASNSGGLVFSNESNTPFWWEITGSSKMVLTSDGNLGLGLNNNGTEFPTETLHVGGNFRLSDGTEGEEYLLTSDSNGVASWKNPTLLKQYINYFEFSGSPVTSISALGAWVKLNTSGTTSPFSNGDLIHTNNKVTYTGTTARIFKLEGIVSISAGNNESVHAAFFKNNVLYPCSEQSIVTRSVGPTPIPFHCVTELLNNDYVEVFVKNTTSTTSITLSNVNVIITEL